MIIRRLFAFLAVLALVAAAAGCGSSSKKSSNTGATSASSAATTAADPAVEKLVPAAIKSKGTLQIGTDPTYAPNEFVANDGKTIQGMDVDLANAIAAKMGLKATMVKATFDVIIPNLEAQKYDLGMSSFTDTKEREKTVDFVTYFSAGTAFYVKAQGGAAINGLADLCGHKVAAEKGTVQVDDSTAQGKKCTDSGKPGVNVLVYPDQNGVNLALSSNRADVAMADSPVADYAVKQSGGQFKISGTAYGTAPYGIAIPKGNGLDQPVLAAMKAVVADGSYMTILKKWGVDSGAISNPTINGATS